MCKTKNPHWIRLLLRHLKSHNTNIDNLGNILLKNRVILLLYLLIALSSTIKLPNIFIGMGWLTNSIVANVFGFVLLILITDYNSETKTYTASNKFYSFWIYIGRISYSLYLFHYPIISFSFWLWGDLSFFSVCIIFLISIGIAGVNFKYVESKYYSQLYLKSKNT